MYWRRSQLWRKWVREIYLWVFVLKQRIKQACTICGFFWLFLLDLFFCSFLGYRI